MTELLKKMGKRNSDRINGSHDNRKWTGIFILVVGLVYLLKQMNFPIPYWVFTWATSLIVVGLYIGIKNNFRDSTWFILVIIGTVWLLDDITPSYNLHRYIWPVGLMLVGFFFIIRPKKNNLNTADYDDKKVDFKETKSNNSHPTNTDNYSNEDWVDATAIFGGIKKVIVSKNFKGGDITAIMGGVELNLSQADFTGKIYLDATNLMGGTKLIIPPTWYVKSEVLAIFGGVEDKRDIRSTTIDPNKILVLAGTCIFGGLEIKSF